MIAILIKRDSPGPVLFRQTRLGTGMRPFTALKFRTMRVDTDDRVHREYIRQTMNASAHIGANGIYKLDRSNDVTRVGRWLRRTSLDELPQLLNVLRGDMSLVGTAPVHPVRDGDVQAPSLRTVPGSRRASPACGRSRRAPTRRSESHLTWTSLMPADGRWASTFGCCAEPHWKS